MKNWQVTLSAVIAFLLFVWLMPREETTATWVIAGLVLLVGGVICVVLMIRKIWRGSIRD